MGKTLKKSLKCSLILIPSFFILTLGSPPKANAISTVEFQQFINLVTAGSAYASTVMAGDIAGRINSVTKLFDGLSDEAIEAYNQLLAWDLNGLLATISSMDGKLDALLVLVKEYPELVDLVNEIKSFTEPTKAELLAILSGDYCGDGEVFPTLEDCDPGNPDLNIPPDAGNCESNACLNNCKCAP